MAKWSYLVEMDDPLQRLARRFAANPGDESVMDRYLLALRRSGDITKELTIRGRRVDDANELVKFINYAEDNDHYVILRIVNWVRPPGHKPYKSTSHYLVSITSPATFSRIRIIRLQKRYSSSNWDWQDPALFFNAAEPRPALSDRRRARPEWANAEPLKAIPVPAAHINGWLLQAPLELYHDTTEED